MRGLARCTPRITLKSTTPKGSSFHGTGARPSATRGVRGLGASGAGGLIREGKNLVYVGTIRSKTRRKNTIGTCQNKESTNWSVPKMEPGKLNARV